MPSPIHVDERRRATDSGMLATTDNVPPRGAGRPVKTTP